MVVGATLLANTKSMAEQEKNVSGVKIFWRRLSSPAAPQYSAPTAKNKKRPSVGSLVQPTHRSAGLSFSDTIFCVESTVVLRPSAGADRGCRAYFHNQHLPIKILLFISLLSNLKMTTLNKYVNISQSPL